MREEKPLANEAQIDLQQVQNSFTEPMSQMESVLGEMLNRFAKEGNLNSLESMMKMMTHKEYLLWGMSRDYPTDSSSPLVQSITNMESALARVASVIVRDGDLASLERVMNMLTHKEYILWSLLDEA